jgi:Uma2 family endonuclease
LTHKRQVEHADLSEDDLGAADEAWAELGSIARHDNGTKGTPTMSVITPTQPIESLSIPEWIPQPLFRISLERYEAMVESGVFTKRDRFHLINGILVAKVTQGDEHCEADDLCRVALEGVLPPGWYVRPSKPVRLPPDGAPEPDETVVRGSIRDYGPRKRGMPGASDIGLIVEIAHSSLQQDRAMVSVYGRAGIPIYWIVNLVDRQVEVYSIPTSAGYSSRLDFRPGENVPVVLDGVQVGFIAVDDIMP